MKKKILALLALFCITVSASAMSYEQARRQALFLTDKMAYELNLTDEQYEAAYEINLDYLMGITSYDDLYGAYWTQRNLDLSYILLDWQYRLYVDAAYFYRPLYWDGGYWHFRVYARYPHRDYFFFGCPDFYAVYHGGHSWRMNGGHSWYEGRHYQPRPRGNFSGMRDSFDRGDYGNGTRSHNGSFGNGTRLNRSNNGRSMVNSNGTRSYGGNRSGVTTSQVRTDGTRSFGGTRSNGTNSRSVSVSRPGSTRTTVTGSPVRRSTYSNTRRSSSTQLERNNFQSNRGSSTRATVSRQGSVNRTFSAPSRSFTPNRSTGTTRSMQQSRRMSTTSRSFSAPSRSFSAPSRSSSSPSRSSSSSVSRKSSRSGGSSFGGRR